MTNNSSPAALAAQIEQAKAHIALAEQLAAAPALLKKLLPEYEKAVAAQAKADAAAAEEAENARKSAEEAAKDARYAGLSDLRITEVSAPVDPSVLRSTFTITYTTLVWDGYSSNPQTVTVSRLDSLPPLVFDWIIDRNADKIPASIMNLCPNDPAEALGAYLIAKQRGYLKS